MTSTVSNSNYGSVNRSTTSVASGTTYTTSKNKLTFSDGRTIVATPKSITGYNTSCSSWTPSSGTVNSNTAITANCTGTVISYQVSATINNASYGSLSASSIWIPYGTTYTSSGNTVTFSNGRTITATPTSTTGYTTTCNSWSPASGTITSATTLTANCARTVNNYTATFKVNNPDYGTVSISSASIPYNTSFSSSGNKLSFGNGTEVTATPKEAPGFTTTCSGWNPSAGQFKTGGTYTVSCTRKEKIGSITYISGKGTTKKDVSSIKYGNTYSIKPLASFAGARYSNIYNLNSTDYKNWTKEGYYFDYWEGSDGKKYVPATIDNEKNIDEGHNPYYACAECPSTYTSDGSDFVLTAHYTKMNNINLAAITLAWPDGYTSNGTMVASNKSEGWSHYVTPASPYAKTMERYKVASTPEFRTTAAKYYTNANRRASLEANSLASNKCDNYHSLGCSGSWYNDDIGYFYGRSCDRFAAISTYYGIVGFGGKTLKMPFGLPAQSKYFIRGDQGWTAVNTSNNSKTSSSSVVNASNMGRYETHYQPGDIRMVYRVSSKHEDHKYKYSGNTYYLGHIAIYVKTEDGLSHIAEAGHATYVKNSSSYNGDFIFANTAYTNGGSFGHLSKFYYKTTAQGYDKNEWYAIWRYTGSGN